MDQIADGSVSEGIAISDSEEASELGSKQTTDSESDLEIS